MQEYGVSRVTIRAAINELAEDGLLQRLQGKGTFVCEPKEAYRAYDAGGFSHSTLQQGRQSQTRLLGMETLLPPKKIQDFLELPDGEPVLCSHRLRSTGQRPVLLEHNYYHPALDFLQQEDLNASLFEILKQHGLSWSTKNRSLEICFATREESALLQVKAGSPLLLFVDLALNGDGSGRPLFYSKQLYCAERLKFYL